jgi:hypothetical protein
VKTTKYRQQARSEAIQGVKLWGEVISWTIRNSTIAVAELDDAIRQAGLDPDQRKEMEPRNAFSRACGELKEGRIIRVTKDDPKDDWLEFQFTKESRVNDEFQYNLETKVSVHKRDGEVICPDAGLKAQAESLIQFHISHRRTADVTRLVQTYFEKHADLFPIRDKGGVYFVPIQHTDFLDKIELLLDAVGGRISRFPVPEGVGKSDKSVRESVARGLNEMLEEYELQIAKFDESTRTGTLDKFQDKLHETQYKIEAYAAYLEHSKETLEERLSTAKTKLKEKIRDLGRAVEEEEEELVEA